MKTNNTFIIVTWNNEKQILPLLKSIKKFEKNSEIIVVDNASKDKTTEIIKKNYTDVEIIKNNKNIGFAKANNIAVSMAKTKYLTFLNPDVELKMPIISKLIEDFDTSDIGIVGGKLINHDGSLQPSIFKFQTFFSILIEQFHIGKLMPEFLKKKYSPENSKHNEKECVDWLVGAFYFTTRELYTKVEGFSEEYFLYSEDMDLCYKYHLIDKKVLFDPSIEVMHSGGTSEKQDMSASRSEKLIRSFIKFAQKYDYPANITALKISYTVKLLITNIISNFNKKYYKDVKRYKKILKELKGVKNDS